MRFVVALIAVIAVAAAVIFFHDKSIPAGKTDATIGSMATSSTLALSIPSFADGAMIPAAYTCDAQNSMSPEIRIEGVPGGAKTLALIVDDPDIPDVYKKQASIDKYIHWVLFNIPATTLDIPEGAAVGTVGANGSGQNGYTPPCPPKQYEPSTHRYFFKLYALDSTLAVREGASAQEVEGAMEGHVIAQTQYVGLYKKR